MKEPQRNNENDWHEDCNKTQQHHWHLVCFQLKRRGEPAAYKRLLKRCLSKAAVTRVRETGLQLSERLQERGC